MRLNAKLVLQPFITLLNFEKEKEKPAKQEIQLPWIVGIGPRKNKTRKNREK